MRGAILSKRRCAMTGDAGLAQDANDVSCTTSRKRLVNSQIQSHPQEFNPLLTTHLSMSLLRLRRSSKPLLIAMALALGSPMSSAQTSEPFGPLVTYFQRNDLSQPPVQVYACSRCEGLSLFIASTAFYPRPIAPPEMVESSRQAATTFDVTATRIINATARDDGSTAIQEKQVAVQRWLEAYRSRIEADLGVGRYLSEDPLIASDIDTCTQLLRTLTGR
jgi:hypothetical protein